MTKEELRLRTKIFSRDIIRFVDTIPASLGGTTIARQIIRSGTSVGANYRAACRAKSDRDFLNKIMIIEEEADETCFWLEQLMEAGILENETTHKLHGEAYELTAIFTATGKSLRARLHKS